MIASLLRVFGAFGPLNEAQIHRVCVTACTNVLLAPPLASAGECALQRCTEAWRDPRRADPVAQRCGGAGDLCGRLAADILQQAEHHLAASALSPAADDPAV